MSQDDPMSPMVTLTNAIILSAVKQRASMIRLEPEGTDGAVVTFVVAGVEHVELRPPGTLCQAVVRRLSVMARLPHYPRGGASEGVLHLHVGEDREAMFSLRVSGHGPSLCASLVRITPEDLAGRERL